MLYTLYIGANLIPATSSIHSCQTHTFYSSVQRCQTHTTTSSIKRSQPHTCQILCTKVPTTYLLHPLYKGANPIPNNPSDVSWMSRGVPSTVFPALITLLFLPTLEVFHPLPLSPAMVGGGSSSPNIQEQVPSKMSSSPVDSSHPLMVELLEMVLEVPENIWEFCIFYIILKRRTLVPLTITAPYRRSHNYHCKRPLTRLC